MSKIVRWIVFLPILFICANVLRSLATATYSTGAEFGIWNVWKHIFSLSFKTLIALILYGLIPAWATIVVYFPKWMISLILPGTKVPIVIFGITYYIYDTLYIIKLSINGYDFWGYAIHVVFCVLLFFGIMFAFYENEKIID